jgi:hypothetical protein
LKGELPLYLNRNQVDKSEADIEAGYHTQQSALRFTRIRKPIHFAEKDEEEMLHLADACAFAIRRYFSKLDLGDKLMSALVGPSLPSHEGYDTAVQSSNCIYFHPSKENVPQQVTFMR